MKTNNAEIKRNNDIDYGSAANGSTVGSGYDVTIKRESDDTALVCVRQVSSGEEWLTEVGVERDQDMQALACHIGQCPSAELGGLPTDDESNSYVDRWNAITVR